MPARRILSIFIDESGDFGDLCEHCPFFIYTLVFHDQSLCITDIVQSFSEQLALEGYANHVLHTGPIIRKEDDYEYVLLEKRQHLFKRFFYFARKLPVKYQTFVYEKNNHQAPFSLSTNMARELNDFIDRNQPFFNSYDKFIVYYDNGQHELNQIIATVFSIKFQNVEFRNALQSDYRLSQVADLVCTLELLRKKLELNCLTKSDTLFFTRRDLKKTYLSGLEKLRLENH